MRPPVEPTIDPDGRYRLRIDHDAPKRINGEWDEAREERLDDYLERYRAEVAGESKEAVSERMINDDSGRADEALQTLAQRVLADPNYATRDWRGIALVIEIAARKRVFGYVYDADDWEAETPDGFDVLEDADALADAMAVNGERWQRCLVQIKREEGGAPQLKVAFDYDGDADWAVTPGNLAEMVEKLRP